MAASSALAGDGACVLSSSRPEDVPDRCCIPLHMVSQDLQRHWMEKLPGFHPPLCVSAPWLIHLCHQAVPGLAAQDDAWSLPQPSLAMQLLHDTNRPKRFRGPSLDNLCFVLSLFQPLPFLHLLMYRQQSRIAQAGRDRQKSLSARMHCWAGGVAAPR